MSKSIILGCCATGAKYTPRNHHRTGDDVIDRICTGADIAVSEEAIAAELEAIDAIGCRYYHYHARNFDTREQTTDDAVYRRIGRLVQATVPTMLVSFGASRNGPEVIQRIMERGEWERVGHAALALDQGGAHFVTMQAAIELQIVCDLERRFGALTSAFVETDAFARLVEAYTPSAAVESVRLDTNSTANGANYGTSSPATQLEAYGDAVAARRRMRLFDEIEWVQLVRSHAMSRMAILRPDIALGEAGQVNVTLLFGFSPKLPFPKSYAEFRAAIRLAKSLERDWPSGPRRRQVTITVGAAVLPQHAAAAMAAIDVGRLAGRTCDAIGRLAAYAAQDDSEVDVLRVGMEDTPYRLRDGRLVPTDNVALCHAAAEALDRAGVSLRREASRLTGGIVAEAFRAAA